MNFKEILELIDRVAERGIAGLEIEQAGTRVRIEGKPSQMPAPSAVGSQQQQPATAPSVPSFTPAQLPASEVKGGDEESEAGLQIITSPIVGTFYRAGNPEAPAFVNQGDRISKGKVLCIIEAMKLMNEIESDIDGVIVRVYPQNGQPVEYGEKLFAVKI
ncbi:MAG TPA: acetyl-CoA carboxylase biotin carboxyl carrier protein [Thermoanaerobaculia bacterium]